MLLNNLDSEVAENPAELVVYGGIGQAARNRESLEKIIEILLTLDEEHSLLVQSGKPVGVVRTHRDAPRVLIANSNLVPHWATLELFVNLLELVAKKMLIIFQDLRLHISVIYFAKARGRFVGWRCREIQKIFIPQIKRSWKRFQKINICIID
jgi:hypothetical protein